MFGDVAVHTRSSGALSPVLFDRIERLRQMPEAADRTRHLEAIAQRLVDLEALGERILSDLASLRTDEATQSLDPRLPAPILTKAGPLSVAKRCAKSTQAASGPGAYTPFNTQPSASTIYAIIAIQKA